MSTLEATIHGLANNRRNYYVERLRYVVTGMPRSGTRYASKLFTKLGIKCGHESIIDVPRPSVKTSLWRLFDPKYRQLIADASWPAAAMMDQLPEHTVIFHQVRNPVRVVRSLMGIEFFQRRPGHKLYGYTEYAMQFVPHFESPLEQAMAFWLHWNELAESNGCSRTYVRYQLEHLGKGRPETLQQIANRLPTTTAEAIAEAVASFRNDVNGRRRDESVSWDSLPAGELKSRIAKLALQYGYSQADLDDA